MIYKIDGQDVVGPGDFRHFPILPAAQTVRTGVFPGIPQRFPIRDTTMPGGVVVEGHAMASGNSLAAAVTALKTLIDAWATMRADGGLHAVIVHGDTYSDVFLHDFQAVGELGPIDPGNLTPGDVAVMRRVRWTWLRTK